MPHWTGYVRFGLLCDVLVIEGPQQQAPFELLSGLQKRQRSKVNCQNRPGLRLA